MSDPKYFGTGADWTQLLTDPALVSHLGELLQVYREATPEKRDQALLEAMRNLKGGNAKAAVAAQVQIPRLWHSPQRWRRQRSSQWQPVQPSVRRSNQISSLLPGMRTGAAMPE